MTTQWYMLDTNTVSYIVNGKSPAARAHLVGLEKQNVPCISVITEAEIRYGLAKKPDAHALRDAIEGFLSKIQTLSWGRPEALAYGELRAQLVADGRMLGNMDMLIAAHAMSVGAVLVTNDRDFSHVKELFGIVSWATDLRPRGL